MRIGVSQNGVDSIGKRPLLSLFLAWLLLACGASSASGHSTNFAHYRVVGYDVVSNGVDQIDADKIDTLIFAFARLAGNQVVLDPAATRKLRQLVALKSAHPQLKVVVSVGGWGAGGFSEAASTEAGRQRFADSATKLLLDNDADGLDVDWEYPGHAESGIRSSPQDRAHLTLLLKDIRAASIAPVNRTVDAPCIVTRSAWRSPTVRSSMASTLPPSRLVWTGST